jgi:hypothetical protein
MVGPRCPLRRRHQRQQRGGLTTLHRPAATARPPRPSWWGMVRPRAIGSCVNTAGLHGRDTSRGSQASNPPSPSSCGTGPSRPDCDCGHSTRETCQFPRPFCWYGALWYRRSPPGEREPQRAGCSCSSTRSICRSTASRSQAPCSAKCSSTRHRDSKPSAVRIWVMVCSSQPITMPVPHCTKRT